MRQRLYPSAMAPRPCPATREWRAEKEPPSTPRAAACSGTSAVSLLPILGCMADHDYIQVIQWAHTIAYTTTQCVSMAIVSAARRGMARRDGSRAEQAARQFIEEQHLAISVAHAHEATCPVDQGGHGQITRRHLQHLT